MITIESKMETCSKGGIATIKVNSNFIGIKRELAAELEAILDHLEEEHGEMLMACIESRIERMAEDESTH